MSIADKLTTIAENQQRVYNAGFEDGQNSGGGDTEAAYNEGFVDGKQAGTDEFWDKLQDNGKRTDYRYAFFYTGFSHLDPKYPINAANSDSMMASMYNLETVNWNKFNLSATSSLYSTFAFCYLLKEVDTDLCVANPTGGTLINSVFRHCFALQRVKKLTAYPSAVWKQSFENCTALTHIIFDGTIGSNGLNLQWSTKLDKESIRSIIAALSTTTSGLSITLSQTAVDTAFYNEDSGENGSFSVEWYSLTDSRMNWTINLV